MTIHTALKQIPPLRGGIRLLQKIRTDFHNIICSQEPAYGQGYTVDYSKYWERRRGIGHAVLSEWQKERADMILGLLKPGATVLDIGCGDGAVLQYVQSRAHIQGIGVDVSAPMLKHAGAIGIHTIQGDIADNDFVRTLPDVDYVLAFEILEHLSEPERLLYELHKKTREAIIFSVPNTGYYVHRLRLLFGRFPLQWIAHPGEHLRFWTARDMKQWLQSLNLSSISVLFYQGLPILNKVFPSCFAQGMMAVIQKKYDPVSSKQ